jgi:hypothetical protein
MTTNLIPANVSIPSHLAKYVGKTSALGLSMSGGMTSNSGFPRISIKASRFRIVDGDTETVLPDTTLQVVIVGANPRLSKTWYAKAWTKDSEPQAPDCFSLDGMSPDAESTSPQNDLCASCPQNAWGSKVTDAGQQIKACSDTKRLAVVAADDPSGPIYLLTVTPAALKGLNQYQKELSMRGIPAEIVKTAISFDTDASFPKLKFGFGGFIEEDTQQLVDGLFGAESVREITGEIVKRPVEVPKVAAPAAVHVSAPKPAVRVAPAPVVEAAPAPAAPAAEPATPKRGFGAAKKTAKPAAPVRSPEPTATQQPAAASLADEIAALVGEMSDDV